MSVECGGVQRLDIALSVGDCYSALGTEEVCLAEAIHGRLRQLETKLESMRRTQQADAAGEAAPTILKRQRRMAGQVCPRRDLFSVVVGSYEGTGMGFEAALFRHEGQ